MSNGCIRCTLRQDLLIESTGISEPLPVAETFTFRDEQGRSLSDLAHLDTLVTVVDGLNFLAEDDERSLSDLLVEQVEFADVILISKIDLIGSAERAPGWLRELRGEHLPETEAYCIASDVYRASRPFHPQRFHSEFACARSGWPWSAGKKWAARRATRLTRIVSGVGCREGVRHPPTVSPSRVTGR